MKVCMKVLFEGFSVVWKNWSRDVPTRDVPTLVMIPPRMFLLMIPPVVFLPGMFPPMFPPMIPPVMFLSGF